MVDLRSSGLLQSHFYNFGQPTRTRRFAITLFIETHLFGRSAVIRILCRQVELVDFLITCAADSSCRLPIKLCIKSLIFWPLAATPRFCNHMLMAGLRRFRLAGARILFNQMCFWAPNTLGAWAGGVFQPTAVGPTFRVLLVS